jgi:protein-tyrosine phosphatase
VTLRTLSFSVTFNFRDVGGYVGLDGRTVRWRRLFRSDSLHRLGEEDREAFAALGIRTVVDLRRPREVDRDGRVPASHVRDYFHIHPEHAEWAIDGVDKAGVERWLADRYIELAETGRAGLAKALGVIADADAAPVVVHCVAGKDRTGVVVALALALLGVDDRDIAADYELTTAAAERFTRWLRESSPDYADLPVQFISSPAEAMRLFLADLRARHGSVEAYALSAGLSVDQVTALRTHLLEPSPR